MKASAITKPARREIFVLTPEEKRTVCFVLIAFVLGLATKHYRDTHPLPPSKQRSRGADIHAPFSPDRTATQSARAKPKPPHRHGETPVQCAGRNRADDARQFWKDSRRISIV